MELKNHCRYAQRFNKQQVMCDITMDADRISLSFGRIYPSPLKRVAEEMENMKLCGYTIVEGTRIWLMHPDFGMFADEVELKSIVSDLLSEENYNIIYKE